MFRKLVSTVALLLLAAAPLLAEFPYGNSEKNYGGPSYLGVDIDDISPERARELKLSNDTGVEVLMVDRDAPAGKAGLQVHDVILKFENTDVESGEQIRRLLRETPAGRTVTLTVARNGQVLPIKVTLARRPEPETFSMTMPAIPAMPAMPAVPAVTMPRIEIPQVDVILHRYSHTGLMVENITPQLRQFFGVKMGEGVLVRSVDQGSAAATAGFKAGDIIVRLGSEKISDVGDWLSTVRMQKGTVPVGVIRDKKPLTLTLRVPEKKDSSYVWPDGASYTFNSEDLSREMAKLRPQFEQLGKQLNSKQFQDSMRRAQDEIRRSMEELRKELEREQHEWQLEQQRDNKD